MQNQVDTLEDEKLKVTKFGNAVIGGHNRVLNNYKDKLETGLEMICEIIEMKLPDGENFVKS